MNLDLFTILLFLHVLGAIVAFGPGFVSPISGSMTAREPQHANFMARVSGATTRGVVLPVSIVVGLTGLAMILVRGWSNIVGDRHWLEVAILLYLVAFVFAVTVQARAGRRMVELTSQPPAPGSGPSAELRATATRLRYGGYFLLAATMVIVFLMVTKPF